MKIIITILMLSFYPLLSQQDSCGNFLQLTDSLIINTGFNQFTNKTYNIGDQDKYWIVVTSPDSTIKTPALSYTIPKYKDWENSQANSLWISSYNTDENGFTNEPPLKPFSFEKYFCNTETIDSVKINLAVIVDNEARIYFDSVYVGEVINFLTPQNFSLKSKLFPGRHSVRVDLRNYAGPPANGNPMGFNLAGKIIGHRNIQKINISLENSVADAGTENFKIPIIITKSGNFFSPISVSTKLIFNASAFLPDDISRNPFISSDSITYRNRILNLKFDNLDFSVKDTIIFYLSGTVLLADSNNTELAFSEIVCNDSNIVVNSNDGTLEVTSCAFDLSHVELFNPTSMNIMPNPANEEIGITISGDEEANYTLAIYNLQGICVASKNWVHKKSETSIFRFTSDNFSSGVYQVVLKSDWDAISKPLVVVK